jgi:acyl-coenzyme A synthetase/AMP-(fatty) acid ligase
MIRYRGEYVPPAELESILAQYPGVADAGVTGVPAEADGGEVPRALVVLRDGIQASQALAEEISNYVKDKTPDHKQLRGGLTFVDGIPRHVSGKLLRDQLQALVCN